jgi:hypothetical protein
MGPIAVDLPGQIFYVCLTTAARETWLKGKPQGPKLPYRLPELLDSDRMEPLYVCESEKCADAVAGLGLFATSASEGAGKWSADLNEYLRDRIVHILPDRNEPGAMHAEMVARNLAGIAREVRIVPLPGLDDKEDVADWIAHGGTADRLRELGEAAPICGQRASTDATAPGLEPTADVAPRATVEIHIRSAAAGEPSDLNSPQGIGFIFQGARDMGRWVTRVREGTARLKNDL